LAPYPARMFIPLLATLFFQAAAQVTVPVGIVRGELLEWEGDVNSGDFSVRTAENQVYRCHFDGFSYLERDGQRIGGNSLKAGLKLEIIADKKPGSNKCYARTIRIVEERVVVVNPGYRVNLHPAPHMNGTAEFLFPRGNLTFSGVVVRINPEMVALHTREGEKIVLLRQDTRYLDSGVPCARSTLAVNTRVFIRAGRNLDDEVEAYQVVWGEISGPKGQ